jgi:type IV secretory pathway VirD2 relaxase
MESDLGTRQGVGIAHGNTDTRVAPRRASRLAAGDGSDLVILRDSISRGLRSRAADLVSAELRSKPEHEIRSALAREVEAERWTRLGAAIRMAADDSASSTCSWTIRASTIRRRAVSPSAICRSWSAWGSPRVQGRANE